MRFTFEWAVSSVPCIRYQKMYKKSLKALLITTIHVLFIVHVCGSREGDMEVQSVA